MDGSTPWVTLEHIHVLSSLYMVWIVVRWVSIPVTPIQNLKYFFYAGLTMMVPMPHLTSRRYNIGNLSLYC